jgi:Ca-activated chloride channel family protein
MDREDDLIWMPFDSEVYLVAQGNKSEIGENLSRVIGGTVADGGTALYDAVAEAYRTLEARRSKDGDTARYGIVVLSDGDDTSSKKTTLPQLEALLKGTEADPFGIQIHTIGVGEANDQVLKKIAESSHGRYWKVKDPKVLAAVYRAIVPYF